MEFKDWLVAEKHYSARAARDVISRLKRAMTITGEDNIGEETLSNLESNEVFQALSTSVKSQIRRSLKLYSEHNASK